MPDNLRKPILYGVQARPCWITPVPADAQQKGKCNQIMLPYHTEQSTLDVKCETRVSVIDDMKILENFLCLAICFMPRRW